jgi:hypothetical protein
MKNNISVKLLNRGSRADEESGFKQQSIKNEAKWGNCSFTFNPLEENYDWLVIIDDMLHIIPKRTELLTYLKNNKFGYNFEFSVYYHPQHIQKKE